MMSCFYFNPMVLYKNVCWGGVLFHLKIKNNNKIILMLGLLLGFCDAFGGICKWTLSVKACLHAVCKASTHGLYDYEIE